MFISALLSQSCDQVLQRLRFFRLQQAVLPAEEHKMAEERVEVRVQAQRYGFSVVRPVNVGQSSEKQQEDFLDEKDETRRESRTWEESKGVKKKRKKKMSRGRSCG